MASDTTDGSKTVQVSGQEVYEAVEAILARLANAPGRDQFQHQVVIGHVAAESAAQRQLQTLAIDHLELNLVDVGSTANKCGR